MRTLPNPRFNTEALDLAKAVLKQFIPAIWKQAFIAPMAIKGDYDQIGLTPRSVPGMKIMMWKNRMEVTYLSETYSVDWDVGRPWHVKGGWVFTSNWRTGAKDVLPLVIDSLTKHALSTTDYARF